MGMKNNKQNALESSTRACAINLLKTFRGGGETAHNACNELAVNK
jgi:hypothetical protein